MKLLAFVYWRVKSFFDTSVVHNAAADWKALVVISAAEGLVLLCFAFSASVLAGRTLIPRLDGATTPWVFLVGLIIYVVNHFFLLKDDKWATYMPEFEKLPRNAVRLGSFAILILLGSILIITFLLGRLVRGLGTH